MSYILEALKRADAERQRGAVPGLHAQPVPAAPPAATGERPAWGPASLAAGAALLLAGAALAWWFGAARPAAPPPPAAGPVQARAPLPPPGADAGPAPEAPAPQAAALPRPAPPPGAAPPTPARPAPSARPPAGTADAAARAMPGAPVAPPRPAATDPALPASAPPPKWPTLAELPEALRREAGPLSVGGSVHAEQPSARLVILNGQVFHEGDSPAPGLVVEQIRPRSVLLNLRGQRFELPL